MQAARLERLSLDPFSMLWNGYVEAAAQRLIEQSRSALGRRRLCSTIRQLNLMRPIQLRQRAFFTEPLLRN